MATWILLLTYLTVNNNVIGMGQINNFITEKDCKQTGHFMQKLLHEQQEDKNIKPDIMILQWQCVKQ